MKKTTMVTGCVLLAGVALAAARKPLPDQPDPRTRTFVWPQRVVACTNAADAALLVGARYGQVPEGAFLAGTGCLLEKKTTNDVAYVIVDFGRELHGGIQIGSGSPTGHKFIRVRFGESVGETMVEPGEKGACNDHAIRDGVIDLPWCGSREIGNTGFRFLRIDAVSTGKISLQFVRAISLMRPYVREGAFRCSDERVNRVWETAVRTVHLCCQEYLWDGIKRDRLVWMGDTHPETRALLAAFGGVRILPDTLDYAAENTPAATHVMNGMPNYSLWWVRNLHDWYFYSADFRYLKKHHAYLKTIVGRFVKSIKDDGTQTWGGFLDWPTQHNAEACKTGTCGLMCTTLQEAKYLAGILGDTALEKTCDEGIAKLRKGKPSFAGSKQAAALLALSGLRDPQEAYREVLGQNGMQGVSTFYGYYMLEAMSAAGENQRALDTVRDYWGAMLDVGATSFWEDFNVAWTNNCTRLDEMPAPGKKDIHGDFGEFCYPGYRHSFCHGWSSGPAAWLINHVLGARITAHGGDRVEVNPFLGDLDWAEGALPTAKGPVKVRVEKDKLGNLKIDVKAPKGVEVVKGKGLSK
ncbi:MAG: alpha-L-rhamnosidase [Kiritimatiellae bacterium]|nr:alpha-L-rhamnosidase [Kiritimatiellia bacterium]